MRILLALILVMLLSAPAFADALGVTVTPTPAMVKHGQVVTLAVSLANTLTPRSPITITAKADWQDEADVAQSTTASTTITVTQPIKINRYTAIIPALFDYVAGSAKISGQPVTITPVSGSLVFDIGRTLLEGESVTLEYGLKSQ